VDRAAAGVVLAHDEPALDVDRDHAAIRLRVRAAVAEREAFGWTRKHDRIDARERDRIPGHRDDIDPVVAGQRDPELARAGDDADVIRSGIEIEARRALVGYRVERDDPAVPAIERVDRPVVCVRGCGAAARRDLRDLERLGIDHEQASHALGSREHLAELRRVAQVVERRGRSERDQRPDGLAGRRGNRTAARGRKVVAAAGDDEEHESDRLRHTTSLVCDHLRIAIRFTLPPTFAVHSGPSQLSPSPNACTVPLPGIET
jgi:hypothetical protein